MDLSVMRQALIQGKASVVREEAEKALEAGIPPREIIDSGLIPAMAELGARFKRNEVYVPEVMIAARAMHVGLDVVRPHFSRSSDSKAKLLIGTVKGDLHDIGKSLVCMMFEGAGFEVIDIGVDVPPEHFVTAIREHNPDIVGMSALLTLTMRQMEKTLWVLDRAMVRDKVKVLVGGAPVNQNFAKEIGADAYAADAVSAVEKAKELLQLT